MPVKAGKGAAGALLLPLSPDRIAKIMQTWVNIAGALLLAAVVLAAGVLLVRALRQHPTGNRAAGPTLRRAGAASPPAQSRAPERAEAPSRPTVPAADWFAQLTVNTPDDEYFNRMLVMLGEDVSNVERARLRICVAVAHVALLLWYFDRVREVVGAAFAASYRDALRAELAKESFEVSVEDYIPNRYELGAFLAAGSRGLEVEATASGPRHRASTPELIERLVTIRAPGIRAALEADFKEPDDGFRLPFSRAGNLVVAQYTGEDPASLPSGEILAAMIGEELGTMVTAMANALLPAAEAAGRS